MNWNYINQSYSSDLLNGGGYDLLRTNSPIESLMLGCVWVLTF